MSFVSIIMPCYNADKFLKASVQSLIDQSYKDWELILVDDGSKDNSLAVARDLEKADSRIRVFSKSNGGYVSARLFGYQHISSESQYLLFYDADDKLHPQMLQILLLVMEEDKTVGAAYCNHVFMDEKGEVKESGSDMPRLIPSLFWVEKLPEDQTTTPFISIFCWTKMIEPMTLIRRSAYESTMGWDPDFGQGQGNIGDGVYLFAEIAMKWKIHFVNEVLYYYRRHTAQSSAVDTRKMNAQANKIIKKWQHRSLESPTDALRVKAAIHFYRFRLQAYKNKNSLKHNLRYFPFRAVVTLAKFTSFYLISLSYCRAYRKYLMN